MYLTFDQVVVFGSSGQLVQSLHHVNGTVNQPMVLVQPHQLSYKHQLENDKKSQPKAVLSRAGKS